MTADFTMSDFQGQLVDVIAEGLPIDRRQAVAVLNARGNRVVLRGTDV